MVHVCKQKGMLLFTFHGAADDNHAATERHAFELPTLYVSGLAAVQFVDGSSRLLSTAEREGASGWFAKEDTKPGAAKSLRMFMESFVTDKFLPEIYLDFR